MQMKICSALALAISAASLPLAYAADATSAPANGFLEESQLTLLSRNVALYRNLKNNSNAADNGGVNSSQNYVNEWGQAEMLTLPRALPRAPLALAWMRLPMARCA